MSATVAPGGAPARVSPPGGGSSVTRAPKAASGSRNLILDGYRGIAAIGVIAAHTFLINQFVFGRNAIEAIYTVFDVLPLFFALSGLMVYRAWMTAALGGRVPKSWPTIKSRLWRILPVYLLVTVAVWAIHFANSSQDWPNLLLHVTMLQVWSPHYIFFLDGPAWFIADDMHFFILTALLAPFLCKLALRFPLTRAGLATRVAIMASLPLALIALGAADIWWEIFHQHNTSNWVRYTPLFTAPEFGFGMLLGAIAYTPGFIKVRPRLSWVLTAGGLLMLAAANYYAWRIHWMNLYSFGYPLASFCCVFLLAGALMASPTGLMSRVMSAKPLMLLAAVGLTIVLIQEPVMVALEKLGFVQVLDPTSCWISAALLACAAGGTGWLLLRYVEEPAMAFREKIRKVDSMSTGRDRRHHGPLPRILPDVSLALQNGEIFSVRAALGDRPLLLAFGELGLGALAEQQFRIDSGQSDALHISASFDRSSLESEALGAQIAFDPDDRLVSAMNIPVALVEVDPDGTITAFQRAHRKTLATWS